jgi:hypothetical protein
MGMRPDGPASTLPLSQPTAADQKALEKYRVA